MYIEIKNLKTKLISVGPLFFISNQFAVLREGSVVSFVNSIISQEKFSNTTFFKIKSFGEKMLLSNS